MSKLHFHWQDHAYEAFGWVMFRGEKTKAVAHLTSQNGKTWHVAVEGLWWRSRLLEDEFTTREGAKHAAEQSIARAFRDLAHGLGQFLAGKVDRVAEMEKTLKELGEIAYGAAQDDKGGQAPTIPLQSGEPAEPAASLLAAREKIESAHHYIEQAIERACA